MRGRILLLTALIMVLAGAMFSLMPALRAAEAGGSTVRSAYTPSKPIVITSDEELKSYATSGSGTPEDPYVIEGLEINATTTNGIDIRNTRLLRDKELLHLLLWPSGHLGNRHKALQRVARSRGELHFRKLRLGHLHTRPSPGRGHQAHQHNGLHRGRGHQLYH